MKLPKQYQQLMDEVAKSSATGQAGSGLVEVTLDGQQNMSLKIKPECVDPEDVEALEDLITAAYDDAKAQLQKRMNSLLPI